MRKLRNIFARNYEAIKLGMLVGLLISNIFLIARVAENSRRQTETTEFIKQQIARDNEARQQTREENKEADQEFRSFICTLLKDLLEAGNSTTSVEKLESCEANITIKENRSTPNSTAKPQTTIPSDNHPNTVRQNPTTSEPPEKMPQQDQQVTVGDVIRELPNVPKSLLQGLGDLL